MVPKKEMGGNGFLAVTTDDFSHCAAAADATGQKDCRVV